MTTATLCLLVRDPHEDPENGTELARAALQLGLRVHFGLMDTLSLRTGQVVCNTLPVVTAPSAEDALPGLKLDTDVHTMPLADFDHVQVLSFGRRNGFLDRVQLLRMAEKHTVVANSVDALMHLNSKYRMAGMDDVFRHPETHASSDAEYLWSIVRASGGQWIVKPPAEAFGRNVFLISATDTNARAILQSMTGNDNSRYCLLQRHVPEIAQGEKRVLIAGGTVVGQYLRRSAQDHRTNLAQGASSEPCTLTPDETALCNRLGLWLRARGVSFAGVDLVYPYVLECNVLSPGGIRTIRELTGIDLAADVLQGILRTAPLAERP